MFNFNIENNHIVASDESVSVDICKDGDSYKVFINNKLEQKYEEFTCPRLDAALMAANSKVDDIIS